LQFAYQLLRSNFDSERAHGTYVAIVLMGRGYEALFRVPEAVVPDTAVCYVEEGQKREDWVVIEDEGPERLPDERSPENPLARALQGKRVGDRFILASGAVRDRTATRRALSSKYAYRHHDCLNHDCLNQFLAPLPEHVGLPDGAGNERGCVRPDPYLPER
jgi:hypothetical protein